MTEFSGRAHRGTGVSPVLPAILILLLLTLPARAGTIWLEAEKPVKSDMHRHPAWYDKVKTDQLSGGDFISNWDDTKPGTAEYAFDAPAAGEYEFWVRANPVGTKLEFALNSADFKSIDFSKAQDSTNIAADDKIDIRFLAWVRAGEVTLKKGKNTMQFRMDSANHHHGMLDCFVFSTEPFQPRGILKPEQIAQQRAAEAEGTGEWFAFDPPADRYLSGSAIDLGFLNEKFAGEGGFIAAKDGQFIHGRTGRPVRFWGVNGPPDNLKDQDSLIQCAKFLAKHGVNLVRIHAPCFDESGNPDPARIQRAIDIVEAMKTQGIYADFSIYWYSFFHPKPGTPWLQGYEGSKSPFAAIYFNPDFQRQYQTWWKALLLTPGKRSGRKLIDEPAVCALEMMNEDSLFFWTYSDKNIPDQQMRIIEKQFSQWLAHRYGSIDAAMKRWKGPALPRDNPADGRVAFRPLWEMMNQRTARDRDTAAFLVETQRGFYQQTYHFLRGLGFRGVITGSNWTTASPQYFGPLDKYSYTACDYVDRHGYFACDRKGQNEGWAVMNDQTYFDRSALRFDPEEPGKPRLFVNPVMDVQYNGKPSMISETAFERPNRFRSEAPLYYACYGSLQASGGIIHFALDSDRWSAKPGFFMQPWTLATPAMIGQFPAAALIYRESLISPGEKLVELNLKIKDIEDLQGTPMPQDASFDELRAADVPKGTTLQPGNVIDPLVHYAGRTSVTFSAQGGPAKLKDLHPYIDRAHETVVSTSKQLRLDYGKGILLIDAPAAQGLSGNLKDAGTAELKDVVIQSDMTLGHIIAVALDGKPLATSKRILLQVMSEEQPANWQTEPDGDKKRIVSIGQDPWQVRRLSGTVKFKRADAGQLQVTALDFNGYPQERVGDAREIGLRSNGVYYVIESR